MNAAPFSAASLTRSRAFAASAIARIPKDFIAPVERHLVRPAHACAALLGLTESNPLDPSHPKACFCRTTK